MLAVILNLFLSAIKFIGGMLSGAVSVTADALNNLTDAVARLPYRLNLRDMRVLHTNGAAQIILGVDVPFEEREKEAEISDAIRALLPNDQGKIIARFMIAPSRHKHAMYRDLKPCGK